MNGIQEVKGATKRISVCLVLCSFACALAESDALVPVRPGGVDGQLFWNGHADWFLYPPSFDFKVVPGAVRYRFTVLDDQHLARTFEANAPTASLALEQLANSSDDPRVQPKGKVTH